MLLAHVHGLVQHVKLGALFVVEFQYRITCELDIVSSDDPDKQMINEFKDEMSFWQSVGLDGFYNLVVAVTDPLLDFKPEAIDNAEM